MGDMAIYPHLKPKARPNPNGQITHTNATQLKATQLNCRLSHVVGVNWNDNVTQQSANVANSWDMWHTSVSTH